MKKQKNTRRKLSLKKEIIVVLNETDMAKLLGGADGQSSLRPRLPTLHPTLSPGPTARD
ncbi:class I lanthipeptide [Chitinophaga nivalis]|uniref:Class I lanthipeptide n=1 Tax=Chitinophaga nivalis TaxID=2991709 RepID=A0ABT3INT2_9BACT|nr:class I lanthipeptide [Chitinophaga nivalis]MCW3464753.1 class I lanthipeptide [Chitinophaga nivalis]MCW3485556.1 class I lanthipeptide [Chitinophaga nivalis]